MQPSKSKKEQVLEFLANDVIELGRVISPNSFYLQSPSIHYDITSLLLNTAIKLLNIIAPRGIAKTTLVAMYIIHHLFLSGDKRKLVVIVSKTQTHAKSILQTIKNIVEFSPGFRRLFGYQGEQAARVWREDKIVFANGDAVVARGTGQPIRGVNENLQRPTLVVVDDPEDENNTKTIEAMETNFNYILTSVTPALDPHRGRIVVIGTPLHERCIVMRLSEMSTWTTVHFGNDIEAGIALWPESRSLEWLKAERDALNSVGKMRVYYQEYECNLIPGADAMFRKEDIQYYPEETTLQRADDEWYLKFPNGSLTPVNIYMGIDPASSVSQSADYSTIVPLAITPNSDLYVLDYFRKRVTPLDLVNSIEAWYKRFTPRLTLIESVGYQEMLRQYLRTRIFIPGLEYKENPRGSKSNRLEMLQPFVAQKKLYLKPSQTEMLDELILFPKSKHDDLLDGLYYACKRSRPPSHSIVEIKEEVPEYQQFLIEYYNKNEEDSFPLTCDVFS